MSIKALMVVAGLASLPAACSSNDDENTEETVGMPGDGTDMTGPDAGMPGDLQAAKPSLAQQAPPPTLAAIAANVGANVKAAEVKADAQAAKDKPTPVATGSSDQLAQPQTGQPNFFVRSAVLRVRSGPGKEHPTVGYVVYNMVVTEIPGGTASFAKIGNNKFVARSCLSTDKNSKQFIPGH